MGIKPRDHVALLMGNFPEFVFNLLALLKIGAVTITINTMLREKELEFILRDSDAVALIAIDRLGKNDYQKILGSFLHSVDFGETPDSGGYEGFPFLKSLVVFSPEGRTYAHTVSLDQVREWGEKADDEKRAWTQAHTAYPDESCLIMYTSGTTSIPKGAVLTHDMLLRGSYASALARAYQDGRRIYFPLPLYHIFAIEQAFAAVLFVGGCMVTHTQFTPQGALALIQKHKAFEMLGVPSIVMALLNYPERKQYDISSLKAAMISAAPAPVPLWKRAVEELGLTETCTGYGMTEVAGAGTIAIPGDAPENLSTRVGREMLGGAAGMEEFGGKVIQYKTVDPVTGRDLKPGSEGEFACRGPIVIRGYYKRPKENADLINKDGWLRTGDLGIIHPDGQFQLTGRSKEVYRAFGENVMPKEVEEHISTYPKVSQVYVVGVDDRIAGNIGAAFIEPKPGETITRDEIIHHCRNGLAKFKIPRYVFPIRMEELPMTATGKIQKFKLVQMAEDRIKATARLRDDPPTRTAASTRAVITGRGAVTPVGRNVPETWDSLVQGRSGIGLIRQFDTGMVACKVGAEVPGWNPEALLGRRAAVETDRFIQFAMAAAAEALHESGLNLESEDRERVGVVMGNTIGGIPAITRQQEKITTEGRARTSPHFVTSMMPNMAAAHLSVLHGLYGPNLTLSTACASGADSLGTAMMLIRAGRADVMLAGGTESHLLHPDPGGAGSRARSLPRHGPRLGMPALRPAARRHGHGRGCRCRCRRKPRARAATGRAHPRGAAGVRELQRRPPRHGPVHPRPGVLHAPGPAGRGARTRCRGLRQRARNIHSPG